MKLSIKFLIPFLIILSSVSCTESKPDEVHAQSSHEPSTNAQPTHIRLSPETTELLVQEMRELQEGMKKIVPALVAGKWQEIASIGKQMEDSYIMKENLTKAQMHELHESLPAAFQELDHSFHQAAGLLAQAADNKNYEQVSYYYYKMTEACVDCHTLYATHKFPEFLK
jgi:hypothetical protein